VATDIRTAAAVTIVTAVAIATVIVIRAVTAISRAVGFIVTGTAMVVTSAIATVTHAVTATKVSAPRFDRPGRAVVGPRSETRAGFLLWHHVKPYQLGTKWFLT